MRQTPIGILVIVLSATMTALGTPARHHIAHRAAADPDFTFIRQAYAYMASGMDALDANKEFEYVTPDFRNVSRNGTVRSKAECMQLNYQLFQKVQQYSQVNAKVQESYQVLSFTRVGQNIIATVRDTVKGGMAVNDLINGNLSSHFGVSDVCRDTWIPTTDGWACQESIEQSASRLKIHTTSGQ